MPTKRTRADACGIAIGAGQTKAGNSCGVRAPWVEPISSASRPPDATRRAAIPSARSGWRRTWSRPADGWRC